MPGLLIFDGDCGFCTASAEWLASRMGERASVAPWQTCDLDALGLTQANVSAAVHWTDDVGTCRGPAAIGAALRHCDRPWSIVGIALGWAPVTWLAEPLYWVVARFRHRLPGSTAACRW